jgi:LPXTG-site transpeptidase (sortase) family protein
MVLEMKRTSSIFLALGLCVALFIILNAGYIRANVSYYLSPPESKDTTQELVVPGTSTSTNAQSNTLRIPSLGIQAPIIYVDTVSEDAFQNALRNGVVHYPKTALPGEAGNVYIFGHSSDYRWSKGSYKTVFALLPKIANGAIINVTNASGTVFTYRVTGTKIVGPKDLHVLDQQGNTKHLLTLQTSYPLGTALKRFIATAELVTSE